MAKSIRKTAAGLWWLIGVVLAVIFGAVGRTSQAVAAVLYGTQPPPKMKLTIDPAGHAALVNTTADPVGIEGYEIRSVAGRLSPTGWVSITDTIMADLYKVLDQLGAGAFGFGEISPVNANYLCEMSFSSAIFLPSAPWSLGQPSLPGPLGTDLTFYYREANGSDKTLGAIEIVPEPGTLCLVLAGVGTILLPRRREEGPRSESQSD